MGWNSYSRCDRCGKESQIRSMSRFNTDMCCTRCLGIERKHPRYALAVEVEREHVSCGDYNFEGIGLPKDFDKFASRLKEQSMFDYEALMKGLERINDLCDEHNGICMNCPLADCNEECSMIEVVRAVRYGVIYANERKE